MFKYNYIFPLAETKLYRNKIIAFYKRIFQTQKKTVSIIFKGNSLFLFKTNKAARLYDSGCVASDAPFLKAARPKIRCKV